MNPTRTTQPRPTKGKRIKARRMWTDSAHTRLSKVCLCRIHEDGRVVPLDMRVAVIDVSDPEALIEQVAEYVRMNRQGAGRTDVTYTCDRECSRAVLESLGLIKQKRK